MQRRLLCVLTSQRFNPAPAGLFFCLASAEGAGLLFCPAAIQTHTSVHSAFCSVHVELYHPRHKTAHRVLHGLFQLFAVFYLCCMVGAIRLYCTACAALERITAPGRPAPIPEIPAPRRTLYSSAQPAYYNKVYKGAAVRPLLWIHARRCNIPQTIPARRGQLLPSADRWQVLHPAHLLRGQRLHLYRVSPAACNLAPVNGQGAPAGTLSPAGQSSGVRHGTIGGSRRISFRAFAR